MDMEMAMGRKKGSNSNWEGMLKWWSCDGTQRPPPPPAQTNLSEKDAAAISEELEMEIDMEMAMGRPKRLNSNRKGVVKWRELAPHSDGTHRPAQSNLSEEDAAAERVYQISSFFNRTDPEDNVSSKIFEEILDELQKYAGSVDIAEELHSVDALAPLLYKVMFHKHAGVRAKAAEAVTTMVQNNPRSQQLVIEEVDGLRPLLYNISDPDLTASTKALGALSALIRDNKLGITLFRFEEGYAKLWDAMSVRAERFMFHREALKLIQYLLHENSSDCNIVTELDFPFVMMHLASSHDSEVRESSLRVLLVLARHEGGNSGQLVRNDDELKQVLQERIQVISAMAPEDLGAAKKEIQLVDSLWNACYNEPSSLRENGLLEDGPEPVQHS